MLISIVRAFSISEKSEREILLSPNRRLRFRVRGRKQMLLVRCVRSDQMSHALPAPWSMKKSGGEKREKSWAESARSEREKKISRETDVFERRQWALSLMLFDMFRSRAGSSHALAVPTAGGKHMVRDGARRNRFSSLNLHDNWN